MDIVLGVPQRTTTVDYKRQNQAQPAPELAVEYGSDRCRPHLQPRTSIATNRRRDLMPGMPVDGPITIPPRQRCMPSERRDPGQIRVPTGPTSFCFSPLRSWSVMPAHGQSSACACADMTVDSYLRSCEPDRCYQHKRTPVQTICTPVFFWDHRRAENTGVLGPKAVV